jgi:dTDP-4-dehydrorhamnose 3,5-epimerase
VDARAEVVIDGIEHAVKDGQSVRGDGSPVAEPIDGAVFRPARTQSDHRGALCEVYDARWYPDDDPVPFVYLVTVHPGSIRGWVVHRLQDDRLFFSSGLFKVVLYDGRAHSRTHGRIDVLHPGTHERGLLRIPAGVYHAVCNVGPETGTFVNLPTRPYDHDDPDKYRLPVVNDVIPYRL